MAGLAVLFHRDGRPVDQSHVWAMLDAIPYRGIDGAWVSTWAPIAFGFAQLATTPESVGEIQPLVSSQSGCAIIADMRLDNREEMLANLPGHLPTTTTDAEIVLRAYEHWGLDSFQRLLGDFAVVIWDPREQRVVCARDTSGQRTLFYRTDQHSFAAASEIQQLFQDASIPVEPDEERILDFLVPLNTYQNEKQSERTFFKGISAVAAGHVLTVSRTEVRTRRYWELVPPRELRYRTDGEYAEHYLHLFSDVVRARLRSAHPVGVMLSGGLDSSSVACVAQELYRSGRAQDNGFASFSTVFDNPSCDERPFIEDIQARYGFPAHFVSAGSHAGRLQLQPAGFQASPNMGVSEGRDAILGAIHGQGVRAILTGDTADACVAGSPLVFDSLIHKGRLRELHRRLSAYQVTSGKSIWSVLALECAAPLLPLKAQKWLNVTYSQRAFRRVEDRVVPRWVPDAMRDALVERHMQLWVAQEQGRRFSNPARENEYRLLYPPEVVWSTAPWPIEVWRPFADRRLHEFLLSVPPERKFTPHPDTPNWYAASKTLIRNSMRGILPESVRTRTLKTVFRGVWEREIEQQWGAYQAAFGGSVQSEVAARGYIDQGSFWARLADLRDGEHLVDFAYVMNVLSLETWLRATTLQRPQLVTVPRPWQERYAHANTHAIDRTLAGIP